MVIAGKTYDTSTFAGLLECVADTLGIPANNLNLQLSSTHQKVTSLNLAIVAELQKPDLSQEDRNGLLQQLWAINRAMQMVDEAANLLEAAKGLGASLMPNAAEQLPPGPPIRRQT